MKQYKLIISTPTYESMVEQINKFYHYAHNIQLLKQSDTLFHVMVSGSVLFNTRVIFKKGRYRFEKEKGE